MTPQRPATVAQARGLELVPREGVDLAAGQWHGSVTGEYSPGPVMPRRPGPGEDPDPTGFDTPTGSGGGTEPDR